MCRSPCERLPKHRCDVPFRPAACTSAVKIRKSGQHRVAICHFSEYLLMQAVLVPLLQDRQLLRLTGAHVQQPGVASAGLRPGFVSFP